MLLLGGIFGNTISETWLPALLVPQVAFPSVIESSDNKLSKAVEFSELIVCCSDCRPL